MTKELKHIGFCFENCDSIKIPVCCVKSLYIIEPKKYHRYYGYDNGSGTYLEGEIVKAAQILLDYNQMVINNIKTLNEDFTRILKHDDITYIDLYFDDSDEAEISYNVPWEGDDYTNNLQEIYHIDEGTINILINKGKLPYVQE